MTKDLIMGLVEKVEHHEILELVEFSKDKYVRKSIMQSKGIVCDFVCFEPGQSAVFHLLQCLRFGCGAVTLCDDSRII